MQELEKSEKIDNHISLLFIKIFMKCIGMWHPKNSRESIFSMIIIIYTITAQSVGLIVMLIDIYFIWGDIRVGFYFFFFAH